MGKVGKFVLETTLAAGAAIGASILYNKSVKDTKKPVKRAPAAGQTPPREADTVQRPNYIDVPIRISKVLRPVEGAQETKERPIAFRLGTVDVKGVPETVKQEDIRVEEFEEEPDYVTIKISDEIEEPDDEYAGSPVWRYADEEPAVPETSEAPEPEFGPENEEEFTESEPEVEEESLEPEPEPEEKVAEPEPEVRTGFAGSEPEEEDDDLAEYFTSPSLRSEAAGADSGFEMDGPVGKPEKIMKEDGLQTESFEEEPGTWSQMTGYSEKADDADDGILFYSTDAVPAAKPGELSGVEESAPVIERVSGIEDAVRVSSDPEDDDSDDMTDDYYV